ncbi:hypothetical protein [Kitasatospora azatica]|uniref:hypothetical protein n=1 Tax=Kitasatospora azatica TaxID=58347 RepID=UPI000A654220|nr:hypothetical protein [Kitasatospora azatica]
MHPTPVHPAPAPPPPPPVLPPTPALPAPPPPSQQHAVTVTPTHHPDDSFAMPVADPQNAFAFIAITVPAVLTAAVTFINQTAGRRR